MHYFNSDSLKVECTSCLCLCNDLLDIEVCDSDVVWAFSNSDTTIIQYTYNIQLYIEHENKNKTV